MVYFVVDGLLLVALTFALGCLFLLLLVGRMAIRFSPLSRKKTKALQYYLSLFLFLRFPFFIVVLFASSPSSNAASNSCCLVRLCALTAFCTACLRTFSGTFSQYSSSFLPCTSSIVMTCGCVATVPKSSSPCSCATK